MICGRVLGDMAMLGWGLVVTIGVGFAVGFRIHAGWGDALAGAGQCLVWGFAFTWLFVVLGYLARTPQAAQGLAFLASAVVGSLLWAAAIVVACVPVAIWRLQRS